MFWVGLCTKLDYIGLSKANNRYDYIVHKATKT